MSKFNNFSPLLLKGSGVPLSFPVKLSLKFTMIFLLPLVPNMIIYSNNMVFAAQMNTMTPSNALQTMLTPGPECTNTEVGCSWYTHTNTFTGGQLSWKSEGTNRYIPSRMNRYCGLHPASNPKDGVTDLASLNSKLKNIQAQPGDYGIPLTGGLTDFPLINVQGGWSSAFASAMIAHIVFREHHHIQHYRRTTLSTGDANQLMSECQVDLTTSPPSALCDHNSPRVTGMMDLEVWHTQVGTIAYNTRAEHGGMGLGGLDVAEPQYAAQEGIWMVQSAVDEILRDYNINVNWYEGLRHFAKKHKSVVKSVFGDTVTSLKSWNGSSTGSNPMNGCGSDAVIGIKSLGLSNCTSDGWWIPPICGGGADLTPSRYANDVYSADDNDPSTSDECVPIVLASFGYSGATFVELIRRTGLRAKVTFIEDWYDFIDYMNYKAPVSKTRPGFMWW